MAGLIRREAPYEKRPWGLILALVIALAAGTASLPLTYLTYRTTDSASEANVDRNARLIRQVGTGQKRLCEQINSVSQQVGLRTVDCKFEQQVGP